MHTHTHAGRPHCVPGGHAAGAAGQQRVYGRAWGAGSGEGRHRSQEPVPDGGNVAPVVLSLPMADDVILRECELLTLVVCV